MFVGFLILASVKAADVKLIWGASPSAGVTNYIVYANTNTIVSTNYYLSSIKIEVGTNLTTRVSGLTPGMWWFTVTCIADDVESDISNVITGNVPNKPGNVLKIK